MNRLSNYTGIIPALITPFDKNGNYDAKCAKEIIDWLTSMNIGGFYITGHTGEGPVLDTAERMEVVESICELTNGRVPVAAHIAAVSSKHSAEMASHAKTAGCIAVSAVPSYHYKLNLEEMYTYYSEIAQASDLPLIIYAQTSAYTPSVGMFQRLSKIENVEGLKYTGTDHYMMGRIKEALGKDFMLYSGCDEMLLSGLISGADAVIGSTYNIMPDLYMRAVENLKKGNFETAQKELMTANAILEKMFPYGVVPSIRAAFEFMGVNAGLSPKPFSDLTKDEKAKFKKELQQIKAERDIEPIALFNAI